MEGQGGGVEEEVLKFEAKLDVKAGRIPPVEMSPVKPETVPEKATGNKKLSFKDAVVAAGIAVVLTGGGVLGGLGSSGPGQEPHI